jgi:hypothetical protein
MHAGPVHAYVVICERASSVMMASFIYNHRPHHPNLSMVTLLYLTVCAHLSAPLLLLLVNVCYSPGLPRQAADGGCP